MPGRSTTSAMSSMLPTAPTASPAVTQPAQSLDQGSASSQTLRADATEFVFKLRPTAQVFVPQATVPLAPAPVAYGYGPAPPTMAWNPYAQPQYMVMHPLQHGTHFIQPHQPMHIQPQLHLPHSDIDSTQPVHLQSQAGEVANEIGSKQEVDLYPVCGNKLANAAEYSEAENPVAQVSSNLVKSEDVSPNTDAIPQASNPNQVNNDMDASERAHENPDVLPVPIDERSQSDNESERIERAILSAATEGKLSDETKRHEDQETRQDKLALLDEKLDSQDDLDKAVYRSDSPVDLSESSDSISVLGRFTVDQILAVRWRFTTLPLEIAQRSKLSPCLRREGESSSMKIPQLDRSKSQGRPAGRGGARSSMADSSHNWLNAGRRASAPQRGGDRDRRSSPPRVQPLEMSASRYQIAKSVDEAEAAFRAVKSILNKLTPEKFGILHQHLISVITQNVDRLPQMVDIIFNKAVSEPHFAAMYASLCANLFVHLEGLAPADGSATVVNFRSLILSQCEREFVSKHVDGMSEVAEIRKPDGEVDEETSAARRRARGVFKFIGELFNQRLLHFKIMRYCIVSLMRFGEQVDEEKLEWLCKLLAVIGKNFDVEHEKEFLDSAFDGIDKLSAAGSGVSSRVRFLMRDLIELRAHKWIPRREEITAKKIADLRKESSAGISPRGSIRPMLQLKERSCQDARVSNGWEMARNGSRRGRGSLKPVVNAAPQPQKSLPTQALEEVVDIESQTASVNGFGALSQIADSDSTADDDALASDEAGTTGGKESSGSHLNISAGSMQSIIDDFIMNEDLDEARLCLEELRAACPSFGSSFAMEAILRVCDKKEKALQQCAALFADAVERSLISREDVENAIAGVLSMVVEDKMELDIPLIYENLARFIGESYFRSIISASCIAQRLIGTPSIESQKAAKLLACMLRFLASHSSAVNLEVLAKECLAAGGLTKAHVQKAAELLSTDESLASLLAG